MPLCVTGITFKLVGDIHTGQFEKCNGGYKWSDTINNTFPIGQLRGTKVEMGASVWFTIEADPAGTVTAVLCNDQFRWDAVRGMPTPEQAPELTQALQKDDVVMFGSWMSAEIKCLSFKHVSDGFLMFVCKDSDLLKMVRADTGECRACQGISEVNVSTVSEAWDANAFPDLPAGCYELKEHGWDGSYGLQLGPESTHGENMSLTLVEGDDLVVWWNSPVPGWSRYGLTYNKFQIHYNDQPADACKHVDASTDMIGTGEGAGQAIRCIGPGKVLIEMEWTARPRRLVPKAPPEWGRQYLPVEPYCEQSQPNHMLIPCDPGQLEEGAFQNWLREGGIDQMQKNETEIDFARRVFLHMAKTMGYSFSPEAQAARTSPGSIVSFGKTDCGGSAIVFSAALQKQGIRTRSVLSTLHVFPEMYVDGIGWIPCDGIVGNDGLGLSGHTMAIGGPPVLDMSHVEGLPQVSGIDWTRVTTCCQMPLDTVGKIAEWEGGRNTPGVVPTE